MRDSLSSNAHGFALSEREREWDEDQARWEAQLKKMAERKPAEDRPAARIEPARTTLELADGITHRDALLIPRALPTLVGTEPEDLVCGKCADVIGFRITRRTARRAHPEGERLVIRCTCGALNLLAPDRSRPA